MIDTNKIKYLATIADDIRLYPGLEKDKTYLSQYPIRFKRKGAKVFADGVTIKDGQHYLQFDGTYKKFPGL